MLFPPAKIYIGTGVGVQLGTGKCFPIFSITVRAKMLFFNNGKFPILVYKKNSQILFKKICERLMAPTNIFAQK